MVGREEELRRLRAHLDQAAEGRGRVVFISGEAGIGKTRLVEELMDAARSKGFHVMSSHGQYESLTPYMPFAEALRSGGLESLLAEETPRVEAVYLVSRGGLLIKEAVREQVTLDADIFASMLTAVGNFVRESLTMLGKDAEGALNTLGYENYRILIETGGTCDLVAVVTGKENEFLINDMKALLGDAERRYGRALENWDGEESKVEGVEGLLERLIKSGKHDGVDCGRADPRARRSLLFENVSLGLARRIRTGPTLLCIEDLQWADPSSLALMHYVARSTCRHGLFVLGTYRPEDLYASGGEPHPLLDIIRLMRQEDLCEEIELERLPAETMAEFLSSMLEGSDFDASLRDRVYEETEGNPLFIVQLVKMLVEENAIGKVGGRWRQLGDLGDVSIPSRVHDVIVRRLDRVEREDRRCLDCASVIGERFASTVLADALDMDKARLLERLRVLERSHRLIHPTDGGFRFDHSEIARVLYGELPRELRMEYHDAVAGSIERLNEDAVTEVLGDLAFHYGRSGNREKALFYLTKAAEKAKADYSNEEAIRFYTEALGLEEGLRKRAALMENLGEVYELVGEYGKAVESYRGALESSETREKRAEALTRIGRVYRRTARLSESIETCTKALRLVEGRGSEEEAFALHNIGAAHTLRGDYDRALACHADCLRIQEKNGDRRGVAESLLNIGVVHWRKGEYDRALERFRRSMETWQEIGDLPGIASSLNNIGVVYQERGDYDQAVEHYERSLRMKERVGDQQGIASSLNNIGVVRQERGDYDQALVCHQGSLKIKEKIGDLQGAAASLHNIGVVWQERGDYDKALEQYLGSFRLREKIGDRQGIAESLSRLAEAYLGKGDAGRALEFTDRAYALAAGLGLREVAARSRRTAGMLHGKRREWGRSAECFEECLRTYDEIRQGKDLAESHYHFGLMWKEKGEMGKARDHLDMAVEIFERMKLEGKAEEARLALRSLPSGTRR